jgi:hypothetical protein
VAGGPTGFFPKRLPASIESIADCPCLLCKNNAKCDPTTTISPKDCEKLTEWIVSLGTVDPDALGDESLAQSLDPK